jgi:hypothetical protein
MAKLGKVATRKMLGDAGELMGQLERGEINFLYHDDGSFIQ